MENRPQTLDSSVRLFAFACGHSAPYAHGGTVSQPTHDTDWSIAVPIAKADMPRGLVTGWAAISTNDEGQPVIDHQGDHIPIAEIEKAVHTAFTKLSGAGRAGDMHERTGVADIVESMVVTAEKRQALGFGPGREGWAVTLRIRDPQVLADVASGRKLELSIKGRGRRKPIGGADA